MEDIEFCLYLNPKDDMMETPSHISMWLASLKGSILNFYSRTSAGHSKENSEKDERWWKGKAGSCVTRSSVSFDSKWAAINSAQQLFIHINVQNLLQDFSAIRHNCFQSCEVFIYLEMDVMQNVQTHLEAKYEKRESTESMRHLWMRKNKALKLALVQENPQHLLTAVQ